MNRIRNFILTGKEKAVAGFVFSAVGTYLAQSGLTIDQVLTRHGLKALLVGVATHQAIYWSTNH